MCLHKWSFHLPPPALPQRRELCCVVTQLSSSTSIPPFFISCYSLHFRSLQKSSLNRDCVLQDGVQIPNRSQSLPSESQTYTENLQEKGKASPSLYHRSYRSQVIQLVAAPKNETQPEFHHHYKWALPFITGINSLASALSLIAWLGSISALRILMTEQVFLHHQVKEVWCKTKRQKQEGASFNLPSPLHFSGEAHQPSIQLLSLSWGKRERTRSKGQNRVF